MSKIRFITYSLLAILTILLAATSCQQDKDSFTVKGKIRNIEGGYFYAAREIGDSLSVDTVHVNSKGEFKFSSPIHNLTVVSLYFNKNNKSTYILVNKGWNIELKGDAMYPDLIMAKGGDINDDLSTFKKTNKDLLKNRAEISNTLESNNKTEIDGGKGLVDLKNLNFELSNVAAEYVTNNPEKIASVMLINTFFKDESTIPRLDETLNKLRGDASIFPLTISLKVYSEKVKKSAVGSLAPTFSLENVKGVEKQLTEYRGQYLLLSFVATTCDMCNYERKPMVEVYNKLKKEKKDIRFLTVLLDHEIDPLPKSAMDSIKWDIVLDKGGWAAPTVEKFNITEIPYNILISPTGKILERNVLPINLSELLKTHTGEKE